jgi:hypothetical protein
MINNARNKDMGSTATHAGQLLEWHFAGSGEYEPQTITAPTREAAHEEWLRTRKPVAKVEPLQEKNNAEK